MHMRGVCGTSRSDSRPAPTTALAESSESNGADSAGKLAAAALAFAFAFQLFDFQLLLRRIGFPPLYQLGLLTTHRAPVCMSQTQTHRSFSQTKLSFEGLCAIS